MLSNSFFWYFQGQYFGVGEEGRKEGVLGDTFSVLPEGKHSNSPFLGVHPLQAPAQARRIQKKNIAIEVTMKLKLEPVLKKSFPGFLKPDLDFFKP